MSGGKETPRQKMIGMMYLFYTALLALNISADILNAFVLVNDSMVQTNSNFSTKNDLLMNQFAKQSGNDPVKVKPFYDKAKDVKQLSDALVKDIQSVIDTLILETEFSGDTTGSLVFEDADTSFTAYHKIPVGFLNKKDKFNKPMNIMNPEHKLEYGQGKAEWLKIKFKAYNDAIMAMLEPVDRAKIQLGLNTEDVYNPVARETQTWEYNSFYHTVLVADIVVMNKYISEVMNTEAEVIATLYSYIDAKSIKFDEVRAAVIPKSTVVIAGDDYQAELFVAAYSKTDIPKVSIKLNADTMLASEIATAEVQIQKATEGITTFSVPTSATGDYNYAGFIQVKGPDGNYTPYYFNSSYQVIKPSGTVSATKMNVVYLGLDNPMAYSASGFTMSELSVNATNGRVTGRKNGEFVFIPSSGKREAVVSISGKKEGGESVNLGRYTFRIKGVPSATPEVKGKKNLETVVSSTVRANSIVKVEVLLKNFPFDLSYKVVKFTYRLQSPNGGVLASGKANGELMPQKLTAAINRAPKNSLLTIMGIYYVDKKRTSMKPKLATNLALNIR